MNRIDSFHDLKATADGVLTGAQRDRYVILNASSRKLYTSVPPELWRSGQWVQNDKYGTRWFAYNVLGLESTGVVGVAAFGTTDEFESLLAQFRKVVQRSTIQPGSSAPWYAQSANNLSQKVVDMELLGSRMSDLLSSSVEHDSLDLLRIHLTYQAVEEYLNTFVSGS